MPRRRYTDACFVLVLILGCIVATWSATWSTAAAAPPPRDLWYTISDGEQRYGSMHVVVGTLEDGALEYRVEALLKIEMMGTRQEHGISVRAVVDPDLAMRRMESTVTSMSGVMRLRGSVTDEGIVVETEADGRTSRSVHSFDDDLGLILDVSLGEWLSRLPDGEPAERRVRVLSTQNGAPFELSARALERGEAGSTWSLEPDGGGGASTVRIDADGVVLEQVVDAPPMRLQRSSREEASQITHRKMPDRELLIFTPDTPLPPVHRLATVSIELTWSDIPIEEFALADSRQRLASHVVEDGRHTAVVVLERSAELRCALKIPVSDAQFGAALGETDFIQPRDERITAAAREIVGEETSALAATRAICRWVSEHIEPAMIAETLSGREVLERRTGKCSEYTTLFASLARAAGIPTRIALGQRRFNGSWGGHMWNEVFIGEWIPVDASVNEVGGSPALLKLVHSDTVEGTQPLRWKLTESLGLEIAGFELTPGAAAAAPLETGLVGAIYTNAEHRFRIALPTERWTTEATGPAGTLQLRLRPPDEGLGDSMQIHLVAFSGGDKIPPRTIVAARLNQHRSSLREFELVRDEAIKVGVSDGVRIEFRGVPGGEGGVPLRVTEFLWQGGTSGYLLNLIATEELHAAYVDRIEEMIGSFESIGE